MWRPPGAEAVAVPSACGRRLEEGGGWEVQTTSQRRINEVHKRANDELTTSQRRINEVHKRNNDRLN